MRAAVLLILFGLLAACQTMPGRSVATAGDAPARLDAALAGDWPAWRDAVAHLAG